VKDEDRCPAGTQPLYRFFNNAPQGEYQPNHRYITNKWAGRSKALKTVAPYQAPVGTVYPVPVTFGAAWTEEGLTLCVPQ
jgi:hypothetical protein